VKYFIEIERANISFVVYLTLILSVVSKKSLCAASFRCSTQGTCNKRSERGELEISEWNDVMTLRYAEWAFNGSGIPALPKLQESATKWNHRGSTATKCFMGHTINNHC
jgi:hypothetical protein